jgi:hypothetical protein
MSQYTFTIRPDEANEYHHLKVYELDNTRTNYQGDFVMSQYDSLDNIKLELDYWIKRSK